MNKKALQKSLTAVIIIVVIGIIISLTVFNATKNTDAENSGETSITDQRLNDGTFYLNGDVTSVKFMISNESLQLITDDKDSMQELYNLIADNNAEFKANFNFDDWYEQICSEWSVPKPYIIYLNGFGDLNVAWDIVYDQNDGSVAGYYCGDYIDENNFDYNGCRFTRSAKDF